MTGFRVHSAEGSVGCTTPYLTLSLLAGRAISFDFSTMERDPSRAIPTIALSDYALYEVLEGKPLVTANVALTPDGTNLEIASGDRRYLVGLAEIALAWNMLLGTPRAGILE